jgi:ribosome maturation factor RimP
MSVPERVRDVVAPVVAAQDLELFDLEQAGPVLRVTIDRPGGVDMEAIAAATRAISRALDEHDPIAGHYTLEVSSPGLERPLRTAAHFAWAVGRQVSVKTVPDHPAGRRLAGTITAAGDDTVTLALEEPAGTPTGDTVVLALTDIEKARTTFEWGPAPKPGGKGAPKPKAKGSRPAPNKPTTKPTNKKVQP